MGFTTRKPRVQARPREAVRSSDVSQRVGFSLGSKPRSVHFTGHVSNTVPSAAMPANSMRQCSALGLRPARIIIKLFNKPRSRTDKFQHAPIDGTPAGFARDIAGHPGVEAVPAGALHVLAAVAPDDAEVAEA